MCNLNQLLLWVGGGRGDRTVPVGNLHLQAGPEEVAGLTLTGSCFWEWEGVKLMSLSKSTLAKCI